MRNRSRSPIARFFARFTLFIVANTVSNFQTISTEIDRLITGSLRRLEHETINSNGRNTGTALGVSHPLSSRSHKHIPDVEIIWHRIFVGLFSMPPWKTWAKSAKRTRKIPKTIQCIRMNGRHFGIDATKSYKQVCTFCSIVVFIRLHWRNIKAIPIAFVPHSMAQRK